ncbi:MAG: response regulator transcription factor [Acidobacteriota bacterium]
MTPDGAQVVVVEDERDLAEVIRDNLLAEGYRVDVARDGDEALEVAREHPYDLMILDVMLPGRDGFSVCETLRREGHAVPILFLTARGETEDRIRGLEAGGDDYLPKPFHLRELLLRVDALLRRGGASSRAPRIQFGDNSFDLETGVARAWDGTVHQLGDKEARVLQLLIENEGEPVGRDRVLEEVWKRDVYPSTRLIDEIVARLRERFERDPGRPRHFHSVDGAGYRFTRQPAGD